MINNFKIEKNRNVGKILWIISTFVVLLSVSHKSEAKEGYIIPDFAFPQQVIEKSKDSLSVSLKHKEDLLALRNVMNIIVAENLLHERTAISRNLFLLDSISAELGPEYRSLTYLLKAEILRQEYLGNQSIYDSRELPLQDSPLPEDPLEWSGGIYKFQILDLVDSATNRLTQLADLPLETISLIISEHKNAYQIGMTIPEFIAFQGEKILRPFSTDSSMEIIPFYPERTSITTEGKCREKAIELLDLLINYYGKNNSLIKGIAITEKASLLKDYERENFLRKALDDLNNEEGKGIVLYKYWSSYGQEDNRLYSEINDWVKKFPNGFYHDFLASALSVITEQRIEVAFPSRSLPERTIKGELKISNINKGYLLVYQLREDQITIHDELILKNFNTTLRPYRIIEVADTGSIPFKYEKEIELSGLPVGTYALIPSKTRELTKGWNKASISSNYSTLRVTDITILSSFDSNEKGSGKVYVVNALDQRPIEGAVVSFFKGDSKNPEGRLVTNQEGWVNIPNGYYRVTASYKGNIAKREAGFSYYPSNNSVSYHSSILTDLSVYRPGDTIKFAIIGWKQENLMNSLLKNVPVDISMLDANYSEVGKVSLKLNDNGRCNGSMTVPEGRLLGNYQLLVRFPDNIRAGGGSVNFQVEEYKLPPFHIEMEQENSEDEETIAFKGAALTYAGLPVSDAEVTFRVSYLPWRWGFHGNTASYYEESRTDETGNFSIILPLNNLKGTIFERGRFSIIAEVTSPSGETEKSSPVFFYLGKAYDIRPVIADKIKITGDSIKLHIPVYDIAGLPVKSTLEYKIINTNDTALRYEGHFVSPNLDLPASIIKPGEYRLEFNEGEDIVTTTAVFWRQEDKKAPYPTPLWIPETEYVYDEETDEVTVCFGSYWNDHLLYVLSDGNRTIETKWIQQQDSLINISVKIPSGNPTLFLNISGLHDFRGETGIITLKPSKSLEKIEIETISFRENINAGDSEEWTFKFNIGDRAAQGVNAFAVLTDKALNAIRDFKWNLNIWQPSIYSKVNIMPSYLGRSFSYKIFSAATRNNLVPYSIPSWQTYGYPFVSYYMSRSVMTNMKMAAAGKVMADSMDDMKMEMAEEAADNAAGSYAESEIVEESQFRPVELPVAFFYPDLKANENGEVMVRFMVPDYNTTWQFQLTGYNNELKYSSLTLDAVSTKPVIVKTNLPRFIRTGDKVEISATLYNNTNMEMPVVGKIEILNPLTDKIIKEITSEEKIIKPSANTIISILYEVPDTLEAIAVRAYAKSSSHLDGEQGMVAIYPSSVPVIESTTFYAGRNDNEIELKIPKLSSDANVTLKYCDNPLWEILLSLPAFMENRNGSSLSIAEWLYGTILSQDIVTNNVAIAQGLKKILQSDDSTLSLSNLRKDESLKIASLQETPWLNKASSETERIRSLDKYLEPTLISGKIKEKQNELLKLQKSDGGFSWFENMNSSPYITGRIIKVLGYLNKQELLPEEMNYMSKKAVKYYDTYIENEVVKNKKINTALILDYLYSRNMFNFQKSPQFKKIEKECKDSIPNLWRHWNISMKAKAAMVLMDDKNYNSISSTIVTSLKEFIGNRLSMEEASLLLEIFGEIEPDSEITDKIKEIILLQKETQEWKTGIVTSGLIHSFMKNMSTDLIEVSLPEICISESKLEIPQTQQCIGNFTINLDALKVSGKEIIIKRKGGLPAWGGIISQHVKPVNEIKDVSVDNLTVKKKLYKIESDGTLKEVKVIRKGDKLKAILNISLSKDMDYIVITDSRASCLQPDEKLSGITFIDGMPMYQEGKTQKTSFFIERLPAGKYVISYDCHAEREGEYSLGISEIQSLYSPAQVAHSSGAIINVEP